MFQNFNTIFRISIKYLNYFTSTDNTTKRVDSTDLFQKHLVIFIIGGSVLLLFIVIVSCAVCIKLIRKCRAKKKREWEGGRKNREGVRRRMGGRARGREEGGREGPSGNKRTQDRYWRKWAGGESCIRAWPLISPSLDAKGGHAGDDEGGHPGG